MFKNIFIFLFFIPVVAFAELENARDLMEEGKFKEAMQELLPAARSGNAEAEELIGVMYAILSKIWAITGIKNPKFLDQNNFYKDIF